MSIYLLEVELPMPAYLHKACNHKPVFNIDMPKRGLSEKELEKFTQTMNEETFLENEKVLSERMNGQG